MSNTKPGSHPLNFKKHAKNKKKLKKNAGKLAKMPPKPKVKSGKMEDCYKTEEASYCQAGGCFESYYDGEKLLEHHIIRKDHAKEHAYEAGKKYEDPVKIRKRLMRKRTLEYYYKMKGETRCLRESCDLKYATGEGLRKHHVDKKKHAWAHAKNSGVRYKDPTSIKIKSS